MHDRQQSGQHSSTSGRTDGTVQHHTEPHSDKTQSHMGNVNGTSQTAGTRSSAGSQGHSRRAAQSVEGDSVRAEAGRGVYSFCMCPGGQIVPTTTNPDELCINGMSFRSAVIKSLLNLADLMRLLFGLKLLQACRTLTATVCMYSDHTSIWAKHCSFCMCHSRLLFTFKDLTLCFGTCSCLQSSSKTAAYFTLGQCVLQSCQRHCSKRLEGCGSGDVCAVAGTQNGQMLLWSSQSSPQTGAIWMHSMARWQE